jgi:hypothetical protein
MQSSVSHCSANVSARFLYYFYEFFSIKIICVAKKRGGKCLHLPQCSYGPVLLGRCKLYFILSYSIIMVAEQM